MNPRLTGWSGLSDAMGHTWPMDDGWDPIRVRVEGDEHPAGPRKKVRRGIATLKLTIANPPHLKWCAVDDAKND